MLSSRRPGTLLSAVFTALAPTLLIISALTVAMIVPRYATIVTLSGAALAAAVYYLLSRSRTSRGKRAGPAPGPAPRP
jgi:lipopolysaccharide export LptBFGC system permease protein LptF